ncbi:alanine racemase [Thiolapillus brandeum]|uniref:Alanine racemase n=1 Tax=Thiolapillus brandeum TaxID=1076588 RepID=A0A7U6JIC6_9GAMM|nr:alanine racemase [Thiolapillus brandeum]BAO44722.1 alanine racemase [Thiolapillus brandeum]
MSFSPWIEIDASALAHNLGVVRSHAPGARVMAVIKANAYGHGVQLAAAALADADSFAVARVEEGLELRRAGVDKPLLVLAGAHDAQELEAAAAAGLELVLHHSFQLALLRETPLPAPVGVWLKVDTGMNRLGIAPGEVTAMLQALRPLASLRGCLTHLANADDLGDDFSRVQVQRFHEAVSHTGLPLSIANSAGILGWPESHADWVRPGIMLYGASPFAAPVGDLQPAMTFASRLISVKKVRAGQSVGYGGVWQAPRDSLIGVVAAGYADGYPRETPGGTPVLVNGRSVPLVGRVSMDTLMVDLSTQPDARPGDEAVLWGRGLPAETIAGAVQTIPYTLFCGIGGRVRRKVRS